ncbi:MAG: hypothetical protein H0X66_11575 [Verrucomicrobia bacterium]|nr:hypothetical protein [Verrucomicrobiota bacterium]
MNIDKYGCGRDAGVMSRAFFHFPVLRLSRLLLSLRLHRVHLIVVTILCCLITPSFRAAEAPSLYGIHDHSPDPAEFLTRIENGATRGWVTATVAVGTDPNNFSGDSFNHISDRGHTVIGRINYGYFPDGTIPVASKWDDFAQRCANFVANSTGCSIWVIANETNLPAEWPLDPSNNRFNYVSPQDYAVLFRKVYNAIKAVRPNDKVIPQAIAQWAGPLGPGAFSVNGTVYPHDGLPLNWVQYLNQMLTAIAASGPLDGIALHIGSRGYAYADIHSTERDAVNNLYWSFYSYKDWVELGIPQSLYHLPLYATECNGMFFWNGGHPEDASKHYEAGWMQEMYAEIDRYNQMAASSGKPIFRCVNLYRWCAGCDGWNIDGDGSHPSPYRAQIMSDLDLAIAQNYLWPTNLVVTNVPPAPTNLTAAVSSGRVTLNWSSALSAESYNVKRATVNGGPYSLIQSNVTDTTFINAFYTPGTTYYYRVSGVNSIGEGPNSLQASATPTNGICDMVVTGITWIPTNFLFAGDAVNFRATISNQGSAASPFITHGIGFTVGSGGFFWHSSDRSMAAGQSLTLAMNGSQSGVTTWTATAGNNTITANVDDINRFPEAIEENNVLTTAFQVYAPSYAVNSGGSAVSTFVADSFFSGSANTFSVGNAIDRSLVSNPAPEAAYQSERWGAFSYTLPNLLAERAYNVRLHFAEIASGITGAGQRLFNVSINGTQILTSFDVFSEAGGKYRAIARDFLATTGPAGQIVVQFNPGSANQPKCSAIEILPPPPKVSSVTVTNGTAQLTVETFPRKIYRLQVKNNLSDANWTSASVDTLASGDSLSFNNSISTNQQRFYRILQTN